MKKTTIDRIKFFIVATLSILLVGFIILGIFGFNGTVDYPNKSVNGYELQVSVDQKAGDAYGIMKTSTEEFFNNNGLTPVNASQTLANGKTIIYKFDKDVTDKVAALKEYVSGKLTAAELSVDFTAEVYELYKQGFDGVWWLILAGGIALVIIFVYALIMEKLAGSVAIIFSSVLSALLFVALLAITRIPAAPFVGAGVIAAAVIGGAMSVATVNRFKEENKNNDSLSVKDITDKVLKTERDKYIIFGAAVAVASVAFIVFGLSYLMIAGAQLLLAGLAGTFTAYLGSTFMWSVIKGSKK